MHLNTTAKFDDTKYNYDGFNRATSASPKNGTTMIKYIAPRVIAPTPASNFQGPFRGIAWSKVGSNLPTSTTGDHGLATLVQSSTYSTIPSIHSIDGERMIDEHRELSRITETLCAAILRSCNLEAHNHAQHLQIEWLEKHIHQNRLIIEKTFLTEIESAKKLIHETLQHKPALETKLNAIHKTTSAHDEQYQQLLLKRNTSSKELFNYERQIAQNNAECQFLQRRVHNLDDESKFYQLKNQSLNARKSRLRYEFDEELFAQQTLKTELQVLEGEKITNEDVHITSLDDVHNAIDIAQIAGVQPSKYYSDLLNQEVQRIRAEYENKIETFREEIHRKFELELYHYQMLKSRPVPSVTKDHELQLEQYYQSKKEVRQQINVIRGNMNEILIRIEAVQKQILSEKNDQQSIYNRKQQLTVLNQLIKDRERHLAESSRIRKTLKQQVEKYRERLNSHSKQVIQIDQNRRATIHEDYYSLTPTDSSIQRASIRSSLQELSYETNEQQRSLTTRLPPSIIQSASPVQWSKRPAIKQTEGYWEDGTLTRYSGFNIHQDCEELHRSLNRSSIDEMAVIQIFCNRTVGQRLLIRDKYKHLFNQNLGDDFEKILNGSLSKFLRILLLSPIERDCFELRRIIKRSTIDESILVEVLFSRSNRHIQTVKNTYQKLFKSTIEQDIIADGENHSKRIFVAVLQSTRPEDHDVNQNEISQDARDLYETERKWRTDGSTFVRLLCNRSNTQLKQIFGAYQQFSNIDIEQMIRVHIEGSLYYTLIAIIRIIRNRPRFFAYALRKSLKGTATNEDDVNRIIATRCEIDMVQIKSEFDKIAQHSLHDQIQTNIIGNYKHALLELLRQRIDPNIRELSLQYSGEAGELVSNQSTDRPRVQWREPIDRFYSDTFVKRSMTRSNSDGTVNETKQNNDKPFMTDSLDSRLDRHNQDRSRSVSGIDTRSSKALISNRRQFTPMPTFDENHSHTNGVEEQK